MLSSYAPTDQLTPCCDTFLHRPESNQKPFLGHWFCHDCGKTYTLIRSADSTKWIIDRSMS